MYQDHFGFRQAPFGLTPNTAFFFPHASQQSALNLVLLALRSGEGFIKVTGEIGLGKTTVCRMVLRTLSDESPTRWQTAYLPNPTTSREALLRMVAQELDCLPQVIGDPESLLSAIQQRLLHTAAQGQGTVLLVDEAQAMTDDALEALRLLTNLETEQDKLLQVVLFGQPELDQNLQRHTLRQLRQRISFSHRIQPLTREQFSAYVKHRLNAAGGNPAIMSDAVIQLIHRACAGVPRIGNILCHKALLAAFGPGAARVEPRHALAAITDTPEAHLPAWHWPWALAKEYPARCVLAITAILFMAGLIQILRP